MKILLQGGTGEGTVEGWTKGTSDLKGKMGKKAETLAGESNITLEESGWNCNKNARKSHIWIQVQYNDIFKIKSGKTRVPITEPTTKICERYKVCGIAKNV